MLEILCKFFDTKYKSYLFIISVIVDFVMLDGTISTSYLFLKKSKLLSPSNIFLNEDMATKNATSLALRKNAGYLFQRSCQGIDLTGGSMQWRQEVRQDLQWLLLLAKWWRLFTQTSRLTAKSISFDGWSLKPLIASNSSLYGGTLLYY